MRSPNRFQGSVPWTEIQDLHRQNVHSASRWGENILKCWNGSYKSFDLLKALLASGPLRKIFGGPKRTIDLGLGELDPNPYVSWLTNLWGRRCIAYLDVLSRGLALASKIEGAAQTKERLRLTGIASHLRNFHRRLDRNYGRTYETGKAPEDSLNSRRDIANFHQTYLDPILFTCLLLKRRIQESSLRSAKPILWSLIQSEVAKGTQEGKGRSTHIVDESTLWWGLLTLIEHDQESFSFPGVSQRGWPLISKTVCNLIRVGTNHELRFPSPKESRFEATPEIYGEARTRILIAQNCIRLLEILPDSPAADLIEPASQYLRTQLAGIRDLQTEISKHVCLIGLTIELTSKALSAIGNAADLRTPNLAISGAAEVLELASDSMEIRLGASSERLISITHYALLRAYFTSFLLPANPNEQEDLAPHSLVADRMLHELKAMKASGAFDSHFQDRGRGTYDIKDLQNSSKKATVVGQTVGSLYRRLKQRNNPVAQHLIERWPTRGHCFQLRPDEISIRKVAAK